MVKQHICNNISLYQIRHEKLCCQYFFFLMKNKWIFGLSVKSFSWNASKSILIFITIGLCCHFQVTELAPWQKKKKREEEEIPSRYSFSFVVSHRINEKGRNPCIHPHEIRLLHSHYDRDVQKHWMRGGQHENTFTDPNEVHVQKVRTKEWEEVGLWKTTIDAES